MKKKTVSNVKSDIANAASAAAGAAAGVVAGAAFSPEQASAQTAHPEAHPHHFSPRPEPVTEPAPEPMPRNVPAPEPDVNAAQSEPTSDDIEVIGYDRIAADDGSIRDVAVVSAGGNEIAFIDVDLDGEADFIMCDANQNQVIDDGELVDVQGEGISMQPLQDAAGFDPLFAQNDLPAYVNDADVDSFMA